MILACRAVRAGRPALHFLIYDRIPHPATRDQRSSAYFCLRQSAGPWPGAFEIPYLRRSRRRTTSRLSMIEGFPDTAGIQPHGLLVALHGTGFVIGQISANAGRLLGREPRDLLGSSFLDLIDPPGLPAVAGALREAWRADTNSFRVTVRPQGNGGAAMTFVAIAHLQSGGITVVEMERDPVPLDGVSPSPGSDSSLRLIRRTLDAVVQLVCPIEIVRVLAREIQRFTGFDRVVVERLEDDGSGEIVADDHVDGMESLLGLHMPASTFAAASRDRFLSGQLRYICDATAAAVPLVPSFCPRSGGSLDLSQALLRSPSATRVRHLAALEVTSTLAVPLVLDGKLGGLMVGQHRRWKYLSHEQRTAASVCAFVLCAQIEVKRRAQEERRDAAVREGGLRLVASLMNDGRGFIKGLGAALPELVTLFAADGAAVIFRSGAEREIHRSGLVPDDAVLSALREELKRETPDSSVIADHAAGRFPSLGRELQEWSPFLWGMRNGCWFSAMKRCAAAVGFATFPCRGMPGGRNSSGAAPLPGNPAPRRSSPR
jgi:light-regulated signal transduction histidine kinase (bacteriophytochrome)